MNQNELQNQPGQKSNNALQNIEKNMNLLESENSILKAKLQSFSEKESLYKANLEKIKSIQQEQEKQYFNSLKDSKRREDELKIIRKSIYRERSSL